MNSNFMLRAIELALNGKGKVSPNPLVGAVIVKNKNIIGEGFHRFHGDKHAEINAINSATETVQGATLYCTMEPCSTFYPGKKNRPCCDSIISKGIEKVVIGQIDPNPMVSGQGVKRLRDSGIEVVTGIELEKCLELNTGFNTVMTKNRPFIHLKWAQSIDGSIATANGESKWISSSECRKNTHYHRSNSDAIIVGNNTLLKDNPNLDARYGYSPSPRPVIIQSKTKLPEALNVLKRDPIMVNGSVNDIVDQLKNSGINSLFVEGGANLLTQFIKNNLWDRITVYIAPKIIGQGLSPIGDLNIMHPKESVIFESSSIEIIDNHMVFNGWNKGSSICLQD